MFDRQTYSPNTSGIEALRPGKTQVWYMRPEMRDKNRLDRTKVVVEILDKTHVHIASISSTDLEEISCAMQGENCSPAAKLASSFRVWDWFTLQ